MAKKDNYEFLIAELTPFLGWDHDHEDERVDINFLSSLQFETAFFRRESNLKDILGQGNDSRQINELERIKTSIDRIIELSKPANQ